MTSQWSLQDAKNKFSAVVDAACQGTPQFVTRRGAPAVVVVSAEKYAEMLRQERLSAPDFTSFLLSMPAAGTSGEGQEESAMGSLRLREVEF